MDGSQVFLKEYKYCNTKTIIHFIVAGIIEKAIMCYCILFVHNKLYSMSYLSQEPEIYQYSAHPSSGIDGSYTGLQFGDYTKQNANIISGPPYNRYVQSQVNRVYQPVGVSQSSTFKPATIGFNPPPAPIPVHFNPAAQINNKPVEMPTVNISLNNGVPSNLGEDRYTNYLSPNESKAY